MGAVDRTKGDGRRDGTPATGGRRLHLVADPGVPPRATLSEGALLTEHVGWRAIFLVNPATVVAVPMVAVRLLSDEHPGCTASAEGRNEPVRVPSAVLVELYRGAGTDEAIDHALGRGFARWSRPAFV